jgi:hypothetical protein
VDIAYDTEFLEDGTTIELISIGMAAADGRVYYAVNRKMPVRRIRKHPWLMANVVPSLPHGHGERRLSVPKRWLFDYADRLVRQPDQIASEVRDFILATSEPHLWADYGAYDHVVLCQLWGRMMDLPEGVPMWTHDLRQEAERLGVAKELPSLPGVTEHNALSDAREVMHRLKWLRERRAA